MPEPPPPGDGLSDFYFVDAADPEDGVRKLIHMVRDRIPRRFGLDPVRDIQILCPMNRAALAPARSTSSFRKSSTRRAIPDRAIRLDLLRGRQGHADRERLRQGGL